MLQRYVLCVWAGGGAGGLSGEKGGGGVCWHGSVHV